MSQIPRTPIPLTVAPVPPVGSAWLASIGEAPENRLDRHGDVLEWHIRKAGAIYQVVVPIQIYGLVPSNNGTVVEGPLYGQADILSDPSDPHDESRVLVMQHIPDVIAYWAVPAGIVGAPDIWHRTVRTGVHP